MGQKTNPIGLRLGIVKTWDSRWFAKQRLRRAAQGGPAHQAVPQEAPLPGRHLEDHHRAQGREGHDRHPHRASGPGHRPQGRAGRQAVRGDEAAHQEAGAAEHRGDQARRPRRPARGRAHRQAARAARVVPPRDEEGDRLVHARRRAGHPRRPARAAWAVRRWPASRRTARGACPCTPCARTSISPARPPTRPTARAA
mgnify:CR=1 FL=1